MPWRCNWTTVDFDSDGNARISRLDETGRVVAMVQIPREEVQGIGVSLLPPGSLVSYPDAEEVAARTIRTMPQPGPSNFIQVTPYPFPPKREEETE